MSNNSNSGSGNSNGITLNDLIEKADNLNKKIEDNSNERIQQIDDYRLKLSLKIDELSKIVVDINNHIDSLLEKAKNSSASDNEIKALKLELSQIKEKLNEKLNKLLTTQTTKNSEISEKIDNKALESQINRFQEYLNNIIKKLNKPTPPVGEPPGFRRPSTPRGGRRTTRKIGKKLRRTLTKAKKTLRKLKAKVKKAKKQTYTQKGGYIWPFKQDKGKKGKGKGKNKKTTSKTKRSRLSIF